MKKVFLTTAVTLFLLGEATHLVDAAETKCYKKEAISFFGETLNPGNRRIEIQERFNGAAYDGTFTGTRIQLVFASSEIEAKVFNFYNTAKGLAPRSCFTGYFLNPTTMIVQEVSNTDKDGY